MLSNLLCLTWWTSRHTRMRVWESWLVKPCCTSVHSKIRPESTSICHITIWLYLVMIFFRLDDKPIHLSDNLDLTSTRLGFCWRLFVLRSKHIVMGVLQSKIISIISQNISYKWVSSYRLFVRNIDVINNLEYF